MKAKLIVEGREFPIEIQDPELQKLLTPKKTGYERVEYGESYYVTSTTAITACPESNAPYDNDYYDAANYYSDERVAKNNARADRLMRQLRRFAVEHRENEIDWNVEQNKYCIRYGHGGQAGLYINIEVRGRDFGAIVFDTHDAAKLAVETFHDELIWYFTEYKDSL